MTPTREQIAEDLLKLAREVVNSWACVARAKRDLDYIHRVHKRLDELAAALAPQGAAARRSRCSAMLKMPGQIVLRCECEADHDNGHEGTTADGGRFWFDDYGNVGAFTKEDVKHADPLPAWLPATVPSSQTATAEAAPMPPIEKGDWLLCDGDLGRHQWLELVSEHHDLHRRSNIVEIRKANGTVWRRPGGSHDRR